MASTSRSISPSLRADVTMRSEASLWSRPRANQPLTQVLAYLDNVAGADFQINILDGATLSTST